MRLVAGKFKPEVKLVLVELGRRIYGDIILTSSALFYDVLVGCPEVSSIRTEGTDYDVFVKVVKVIVKAGVKFLRYTTAFEAYLPDLSTVEFVVPVEKTVTVYEVQDGN